MTGSPAVEQVGSPMHKVLIDLIPRMWMLLFNSRGFSRDCKLIQGTAFQEKLHGYTALICDISALYTRSCWPWHTDAVKIAYRTHHHQCIYEASGQTNLYDAMLCTTLWWFLHKEGLTRVEHVPPTTFSKENLTFSQTLRRVRGIILRIAGSMQKCLAQGSGFLMSLYFSDFTTVGQQGFTLKSPEHYKWQISYYNMAKSRTSGLLLRFYFLLFTNI